MIKDKIENIKEFGENHIPIVTFKSLEGIDWLKCGFSTRLGGVSKGCFSSMNMSFCRGDDAVDVMENIRLFSEAVGFKPQNIVMPHQCHTTNVQIVGKNECGRGIHLSLLKNPENHRSDKQVTPENLTQYKDIPGTEEEVDGQITNESGVVLYVLGADCVPVFLVDVEKKVISAVHAGWRGTADNIVQAAIDKMRDNFGSDTRDIKAVIGPSICQDCYEVSADVADIFVSKYILNKSRLSNNDSNQPKDQSEDQPKDQQDVQYPIGSDMSIVRPASGDFDNNQTQKYYLNLWEANRVNLINTGIKPENIEVSGICTKCHSDIFYSHRAHGNDRGVNCGYITIRSKL